MADPPMRTSIRPTQGIKTSAWQQWLEHPEKLGVHRPIFQIHLWLGMIAGLYVFVMSVSGSAFVYRNSLEGSGTAKLRVDSRFSRA